MADMYYQKEKLILEKYGLAEQDYRAALDKYHADHRLSRITQEIIEAMEKSTRGEMPNLEVDKKVNILLSRRPAHLGNSRFGKYMKRCVKMC